MLAAVVEFGAFVFFVWGLGWIQSRHERRITKAALPDYNERERGRETPKSRSPTFSELEEMTDRAQIRGLEEALARQQAANPK